MSDFLVTIDGKYLYVGLVERLESLVDDFLPIDLDEIIPDQGFDYDTYKFTFDEETGRVSSAGRYFALYSSKTSEFTGYISAENFWINANPKESKFVVPSGLTTDLRLHRDFSGEEITAPKLDIISPEEGDRIILANRKVKLSDSGVYKISYGFRTFTYPDSSHPSYDIIKDGLDYLVVDNEDVSTQVYNNPTSLLDFPDYADYFLDEDFNEIDIGNYVSSVKLKKFLRPNDVIPSDLTAFEVDVVESVAFIFDALSRDEEFMTALSDEGLLYIFEKHFEIINDLTFEVVDYDSYYETVNLQYFQLLRVRLLDFQAWVRGGQWYLKSKTEF